MSLTIDRKKFKYFCEWNPRLGNVLDRMAKFGDDNRILKMKLIGTRQFEFDIVPHNNWLFFAESFIERENPIEFKETIIDYHKHAHGTPISVESVLEEFDLILKEYPEIGETIIVDQLIFVDNHGHGDWERSLVNGYSNKIRYMALMHRNLIKLTGKYRKAIPDLLDADVYRPLVLAKIGRFTDHWGMKNLDKIMFKPKKKDKIIDAEITNFPKYRNNFHHLWVNKGDIEAFLVNPHTREAVRIDEPISAVFDHTKTIF